MPLYRISPDRPQAKILSCTSLPLMTQVYFPGRSNPIVIYSKMSWGFIKSMIPCTLRSFPGLLEKKEPLSAIHLSSIFYNWDKVLFIITIFFLPNPLLVFTGKRKKLRFISTTLYVTVPSRSRVLQTSGT